MKVLVNRVFSIRFLVIVSLVGLFVFIFFVNNHFPFVSADEKEEETIEILTHKKIVTTTERFMELIIQDSDENYKLKKFDTKEELLHALNEVTTRAVADPYVDYYFTEKHDGLYILPTETPPWFVPENEYSMIQLSEIDFLIQQTNYSYNYGEYTIEFHLTYEEGWKIMEINVI